MAKRLRRLRMGLSTLLGLRRQGFFIPYRYAHTLPGPGQRGGYPALEKIFVSRRSRFADLLHAMDDLAADVRRIGDAAPPAPRWRQSWFPRLDAAAAYTLVRRERPAQIVEVGSGHSTRFFARAVADGGLATRITAVDPAPRADIAALGVELVAATAHAADPAVFAGLAAGDMLFIDSSHILMPGSDVDLLFGRVLPLLPAGVLVHIHDICLPDDYPAAWDWRGYNEQQGVATLLQGGGYEVLWSSHYVKTRMAEAVAASPAGGLDLMPGALETSLWLRKRNAP